MKKKHEQALADIEKLLPRLARAATEAADAQVAERQAELRVLERLIELIEPQVAQLADIIIVRREEFTSEAQPSLNQFRRDDYPERGVLVFDDGHVSGTGTLGRQRISARRIYLLKGGRLLLVESDGFREERPCPDHRPDRHEVWAATAVEVTPAEALDRIALIEMVLDTARGQLEMAVDVAEDTVVSSAERTAKLLKLVDGMN